MRGMTNHWIRLDTRPDPEGNTARGICSQRDWASDWGTPVEAFEGGAQHTAELRQAAMERSRSELHTALHRRVTPEVNPCSDRGAGRDL